METPTPEDASASQEAGSPGPSDARDRLRSALVGLAAITLMLVFGQWLYVVTPTMLVLGPVVGVAAALSCRRPSDAAVLAAVAVPLGNFVASQLSVLSWAPTSVWLPASLEVAAIAAVVALAANWATRSSRRLEPVLAAFAVAAIVAGTFYAGVGTATVSNEKGVSIVTMMTGVPELTKEASDDVLYLNFVDGVRRGNGYYRSVAQTLLEGNRVRDGYIDAAATLSYRLPALYELFALFPPNGTWFVLAMLTMGSCAAVAAYALARTAVTVPFALAGCTAVAAFYASVAATPVALFTEPWGGALGLIALALFAHSRIHPRHRTSLVWACAAVALVAALVRELAAPFLLLGLVASLAEPEPRARREWVPFALGLAVTAVAYALHASAVAEVVRELQIAKRATSVFPWLNVDGLGLRAMIFRYAYLVGVPEAVCWLGAVAAGIGSIIGSRDRGVRLFAGAVVIGGSFLFLFLHPEGRWTSGLPPAYWADIIIPSLVACIPLAFALVPGARAVRDRAPDDAAADTVSDAPAAAEQA